MEGNKSKVFEVSDIGGSVRQCKICGKIFIAYDNTGWVYRDKEGNLACSYTCHRASTKPKSSRKEVTKW